MNQTKLKSRRDFLADGVRAVFVGGFVFMGLFLGRRRQIDAGTAASCSADLLCRKCSKIRNCQESIAQQERKRMSDNRNSV